MFMRFQLNRRVFVSALCMAPILALTMLVSGSVPASAQRYEFVPLARFNGDNGSRPESGPLLPDGAGNFYGAASRGGNRNGDGNGHGVIYKYSASGGIEELARFDGYNGSIPLGGVVTDGKGNLFGTTQSGGNGWQPGGFGDGTLFEYSPVGGLRTLSFFDGQNGKSPKAAPWMDSAGHLYGTTDGFDNLSGCIFEYSDPGPAQSLDTFKGKTGEQPWAPLIPGGDGFLYGTAVGGGEYGKGTIFRYSPSTGIETLASFNGANGRGPWSALVTDGRGFFYGTTHNGGATDTGTIFEYSAAGGLKTLYEFDAANPACRPEGPLIRDASGNLYGSSGGVIFMYSATRGYRPLLRYPFGKGTWGAKYLVMDKQGNIFGTSGVGQNGSIFELKLIGP
jgi:uncharacterized repeat protein (TIGR03803 family)